MLLMLAIFDPFIYKIFMPYAVGEINTHAASLKILIKSSRDKQHLLISHYTCNGVNDIT